jgi:hypothetical protein
MLVSIAGGQATFQDQGWSSSYMQWSSALGFRDTTMEVDMSASTATRSLSFIMWGTSPNYVITGLQRDEQNVYLWVVVNGQNQVQLSANVASIVPNKVQRVGLLIQSNGQIQSTVDGVVVLTATADLSAFPTTLLPSIGANAYTPQTFTFDNLVVHQLPSP